MAVTPRPVILQQDPIGSLGKEGYQEPKRVFGEEPPDAGEVDYHNGTLW